MKEKFGCEQSKLNGLLNLIKGVKINEYEILDSILNDKTYLLYGVYNNEFSRFYRLFKSC